MIGAIRGHAQLCCAFADAALLREPLHGVDKDRGVLVVCRVRVGQDHVGCLLAAGVCVQAAEQVFKRTAELFVHVLSLREDVASGQAAVVAGLGG